MAFLLPLGEIVMEGIAEGTATNMGQEIINTFAPKIKEGAMDLLGNIISGYAAQNPKGFIAQTLDKSYQHARYPRERIHHSHRIKRSGHRRTR